MATKSGRFAILEQFLADGMNFMFGNPGTVEQGFLDALSDYPQMKYVLTLQESVAVLPTAQSEHLLKVARSVARDADQLWAELWAQFKPHVTTSGVVLPGLDRGFVPACGWAEFLEKIWLLKHYLDSIQRICDKTH